MRVVHHPLHQRIRLRKHHLVAIGLFVAVGLFFILVFSPFSHSDAVSITNTTAEPGAFHLVANSQGTGAVVASIVGPGPTEGSQRFYVSYFYSNNTFDILSINPDDGTFTVFHNPVAPTNGAPENGARNGAAVGPDGNIYFGTDPHAHFIRIDPKANAIVDLGRPAKTESNMWNVGVGSDGKIYGVTYPNCKLVSYDPATGALADLGQMDPTEKYGLTILGDNDGWLYIGVGYEHANIVAYNIKDKTATPLLSADQRLTGQGKVYRGTDGNIYGTVNGIYNFQLSNGTAIPLAGKKAFPMMNANVLSDNRALSITLNGTPILTVTNPSDNSKTTYPLNYNGSDLKLFRVGLGPDNALYASTILPLNLVKINDTDHTITPIGNLGQGEAYSLLSYNNSLLIAAYGGLASLMAYHPNTPFSPSAAGNPSFVPIDHANDQWRPQALITGPDGNVYMGSIASYGLLSAPLVVMDHNNVTTQYSLYPNEGIVSFTTSGNTVIGGTTVIGGNGAHQVDPSAQLFIWNTETKQKEFDIVPVPTATRITDLITAPNGIVYGIAGIAKQSVLFEFDPATKKLLGTQPLPFAYPGDAAYNSVGLDAAGTIWGLEPNGIFNIDPTTDTLSITSSPYPITGGFAMQNGQLYFTSNNALYSYTLPASATVSTPTPPTPSPSGGGGGITLSGSPVPSSTPVVAAPDVLPEPPAATTQGFWSFIPFIKKVPKASVSVTPVIPASPSTTTANGKKSYDIVSAQYTLNGVLIHTSTNVSDGWKLDVTSLQDGAYTLTALYHYADGTTDTTTNSFTVDNTPNALQKLIQFIERIFKK